MKQLILISAAVSAVSAVSAILGAAQSAHAADLKAGDWTVCNGGGQCLLHPDFLPGRCRLRSAVGGLAVGGEALGCGGKRTTLRSVTAYYPVTAQLATAAASMYASATLRLLRQI